MNKLTFSYCVLGYCPDPGAGELLNVGILLYCPANGQLVWRFDTHFTRLSQAFAGFKGAAFRAGLDRLAEGLQQLKNDNERPLVHDNHRFKSALSVLRSVLIDEGLSFQITQPRNGITDDLDVELGMLFERMVTSRQAPRKDDHIRRNDEQVWRGVFEPALPADVRERLRSKSFSTPAVDVEFDHAFKNGRWHVVQPVSLDYKTADTVRRRAQQWAGTTLGLQGAKELEKIYFLLGKPHDRKLFKPYEKAIQLLSSSPIDHEIVEESEAREFAATFTDIVRHTRANPEDE